MRALKINRLTADRIAQAYPIIQMVMPELTFEAWSRFAHSMIAEANKETGGIVAVENEQSYIVGLGSYRLEDDLRDRRTLVADHFMAVDLIRREAVAEALAGELESLAQQIGCSALHTHLPDASAKPSRHWLVELMQTRGHAVSELLLRKPLTTGA